MRGKLRAMIVVVGLLLATLPAARPARAAEYVVTTTTDSGNGSLRWAITEANNNAGPDIISFNISGCGTVCVISPTSALPTLSGGETTIDGTTQPGARAAWGREPASLKIVIDGSGAGASSPGLNISSADNEIRGLVIRNFQDGIYIAGVGATGNVIAGNYIGTDPDGAASQGNTRDGVRIVFDATGNTIGGTLGVDRNIISGNGQNGVYVFLSEGNTILGNYIGTDYSGTIDVGNAATGVYLGGGARFNTVGGDPPWDRNIISGNDVHGVLIVGTNATSNTVSANYIGLWFIGSFALPNELDGVYLADGAHGNTIGGGGAGNVISGNGRHGVSLNGSDVVGNAVLGNHIGISPSGGSGVRNAGHGVYIRLGAHDNTIGGDPAANKHNVISDNAVHGVCIEGSATMSNTVGGNYIGTDPDGTGALGNADSGVYIGDGAHGNTIGGNTAAGRNIISGNNRGVMIEDSATSGNTILGNYIGTDLNGTAGLGNSLEGVYIAGGAHDITVGGDGAGEGNLISANQTGVHIGGGTSMSNTVSGNYIGTDASGTAGLGNTNYGVLLENAQHTMVGGDSPAERNVISDNQVGVRISGAASVSNTVSGNYIGTDASGTVDLGNTNDGVLLLNARDTIVGGDTSTGRNVISGNGHCGVRVGDSLATGNLISGNYIGTDFNGVNALGNDLAGVRIEDGANHNTIGGDTADERNVISANGQYGVRIEGGATANTVVGNYIGTDATGALDLGNTQVGVFIHLGAQENIVGGDTAGERNVISGNGQYGVRIYETDTMSNTVVGNYIGTDATGASDLGNGVSGVIIHNGARSNVVGGLAAGEGNVISGNDRNGVEIKDSGTEGNVVQGNIIGLAADGITALSNDWFGAHIYFGAQDNTVGPGNVIAHNLLGGLIVADSTTIGNVITENSIYSNDGNGIVLVSGANGGIQAPVIVGVIESSVEVTGTACPSCTVELFENPDDSGEGKTYLGSTVADGSGVFTVTVAGQTQPYLTATATDVISGTSTFSEVYGPEQWLVYLPVVFRAP